MSARVDRALGVKPYSNAGGYRRPPAKAPLALGRVLKIVLGVLLLAGCVGGLHATSDCQPGVRCAD